MKIIIEFQETDYKDEAQFRERLAVLCKECGYDCIEYDEEIYEMSDDLVEAIEKVKNWGAKL